MKISIIQSNIADEPLIAIFVQILLLTVHKQFFYLKDCFIVRDKFFCLSIYFFAFTPLLKMLVKLCPWMGWTYRKTILDSRRKY